MCGIAGVLEFDQKRQPSREGLARMARLLTHRGPDQEGFYQSGPVGFAHRRLSIIDLVSGTQPMESPDGQVCVVFNGEIYNYPELKTELERAGDGFSTRSDTEVLLNMYLRYGFEAFARLNGMFACAFWDNRARQLVLARDRLGKKPLFYFQNAERFLFGSEMKALLAYGGVETRVNLEALHEYLTWSYIGGEHTILEGVFKLPPAHLLVVRDSQVRTFSYWELEFQPSPTPPSETEAVEQLEHTLRSAVKRRLMSDVPLGAFLSGGLDSSSVVALMAQLSDRPVKTFTVGFEESEYSELEDARIVAQHLGTDHHELIVKPSAIEILEDLVWHLDEPFGDSSAVPTYYVCRAARQHVTVALSGDGGDEVFAGYARYLGLARHQRMGRISPWVRRSIIRHVGQALPFTWPGRNYLIALGQMKKDGIAHLGIYPYIRDDLYAPDFLAQVRHCDPTARAEQFLAQAAHLDPISRYQYLDTRHYLTADILTKMDRMSMANSLEVRCPLLDHTLVEYMATLPVSLKFRDGVTKHILRKLCGRWLPPRSLTKPKQGFAIPKDRWFKQQLNGFARDILLDSRTLARGYFRVETLERLLRHHATGRRDYSNWIWCLIVLEMWHRTFLDSPLQIPDEADEPLRLPAVRLAQCKTL